MSKLIWFLVRFSPRRFISRCFGLLSRIPLPVFLAYPLLRLYVWKFGANKHEAAKPLRQYRSLGEFFVRDLKPGLRPIGKGIVSPVDGLLTTIGVLDEQTLIQAKGLHYPVGELLGNEELAKNFVNGSYLTFYLAPGDYHHIHSPVIGLVREAIHMPGDLWPVHELSVSSVPKLFCRNERVAVFIESQFGLIAVVMVGALNVGSIKCRFHDFRTNKSSLGPCERWQADGRVPLPAGERLGTFALGSSVIVLFQPGKFSPLDISTPRHVRFGETLGNA